MAVEASGAAILPERSGKKFDYNDIEPQVANFLKGHAARVRRSIGKSVIQIGNDLTQAKRYLSHGVFLRWVESEVGLPARTAQDYMKVAQWARNKSANVALLPSSILYILSANSTPSEVTDEVLEALEKGENVTVGVLRSRLREMRSDNIRAKRSASLLKHDRIMANDIDTSIDHSKRKLVEMLQLLSHKLEFEEFCYVKSILTNDIVLGSTDVAHKLQIAFDLIAYPVSEHGHGLSNVSAVAERSGLQSIS